MLDHCKLVVGQAHHTGDVLSGTFERGGANYQCGFAALLEGDAVMQTARRATTSITGGDEKKISLFGERGELHGISR